jgi:hypothetical protein
MSEQSQDGPKLTREQKANLQRHLLNQTAQRSGSPTKRGNKKSKWPWILAGMLAFIAIYVGQALWLSHDDKVSLKTALLWPLFFLVYLAIRSLWRALVARR